MLQRAKYIAASPNPRAALIGAKWPPIASRRRAGSDDKNCRFRPSAGNRSVVNAIVLSSLRIDANQDPDGDFRGAFCQPDLQQRQ